MAFLLFCSFLGFFPSPAIAPDIIFPDARIFRHRRSRCFRDFLSSVFCYCFNLSPNAWPCPDRDGAHNLLREAELESVRCGQNMQKREWNSFFPSSSTMTRIHFNYIFVFGRNWTVKLPARRPCLCGKRTQRNDFLIWIEPQRNRNSESYEIIFEWNENAIAPPLLPQHPHRLRKNNNGKTNSKINMRWQQCNDISHSNWRWGEWAGERKSRRFVWALVEFG